MSKIEQLMTEEQITAGVLPEDDSFCRDTAVLELHDYYMANISLVEARRLASETILLDYYSLSEEELKTAYSAFKGMQ